MQRQLAQHIESLAQSVTDTVTGIKQQCEKEQLEPGALKIPAELELRVVSLTRFATTLPQCLARLTRLDSKLHSIKGKAEDIRKRPSLFKQAVGGKGYADKLKDLEEDLKNARADFEARLLAPLVDCLASDRPYN